MKRRASVRVTVLLCALALVLPATAAAGTKGFHVTRGTKGFAVTQNNAPKNSATEPTIDPAPGKNAKKEWFVTNNGDTATLLAVTKAGNISKVAKKLATGVSKATSSTGAKATYGSAIMDGYDWLVKYGQTTSPLYAISPSGKVTKVTSDVGKDITDLTAGPDDTLNFSSESVGPISCTITGDPDASCSRFSLVGLLNSLLGFAHLDSIAADSGKLWFTDNTGELGNVNLLGALGNILGGLLNGIFGGPFGDAPSGAGEGSASANTITADKNGYLYLAGGHFTTKVAKNNTIIKVNPKTGKTVKKYTHDLTNVTSLTSGYGDNVWFLDKKSATTGKVGVLDTQSGKITEYKLPVGFKFSPHISEISVGPKGSKRLYFTLETKSGHAAIGVIGPRRDPR